MKEKILSIGKKDFRYDYVRGRGKGGQKKNKTCSAVRCTHIASKAAAWCENGRSQLHNKRAAFLKVTNSPTFKKWLKVEIARISGEFAELDTLVDETMQESNLKIEVIRNKLK